MFSQFQKMLKKLNHFELIRSKIANFDPILPFLQHLNAFAIVMKRKPISIQYIMIIDLVNHTLRKFCTPIQKVGKNVSYLFKYFEYIVVSLRLLSILQNAKYRFLA